MTFGLRDEVINKINSVFAQFPNIREVIIYGSRAKGDFKTGSDIDLAIKGVFTNNSDIVTALKIKMEELPLLHSIDLSCYDDIKNKDLTEHIDRVGQVF